MGRPALGEAARSVVVTFRLSAQEAAKVDAAVAAGNFRDRTEFLRTLIYAALAAMMPSIPAPHLPHDHEEEAADDDPADPS